MADPMNPYDVMAPQQQAAIYAGPVQPGAGQPAPQPTPEQLRQMQQDQMAHEATARYNAEKTAKPKSFWDTVAEHLMGGADAQADAADKTDPGMLTKLLAGGSMTMQPDDGLGIPEPGRALTRAPEPEGPTHSMERGSRLGRFFGAEGDTYTGASPAIQPKPAPNELPGVNPLAAMAKPATGGSGGGGKKTGGGLSSGTASAPTANIEDDQDMKDMKELIKKYEGGGQVDLSPLIALNDSWTGGNLMKGYTKPMTSDERDKIVIGLKQHLYEKEADLRYKKAVLSNSAANAQLKAGEFDRKLQNNIDVAKIREAGKGNKEASAQVGKAADHLYKMNRPILDQIAFKQHAKGNPNDKQYKNYAPLVHQEALDRAHRAVDMGIAPDLDAAYQQAVSAMITRPAGGDGAPNPDMGGGQ